MNKFNTVQYSADGYPKKIKVLMYHLVSNDIALAQRFKNICIYVDEFRRDMACLDRWGFTAITFKDYLLYLSGELNLPKKPIIITFDDGFSDTAKYAVPILKEFGMKAVFFVIGDRKIKTSFWDLKMTGLPQQLMNADQILELHETGFEIGSHTMRHGKLSELGREQAWEEISRSRISLEILLNAPVHSFAYPYGLLDQTVKKLAMDSGYLIACATYTGPPQFGEDKYEIRRILIPGNLSLLNFALRVCAPYQYYNFAYWKIKKMLFPEQSFINMKIR